MIKVSFLLQSIIQKVEIKHVCSVFLCVLLANNSLLLADENAKHKGLKEAVEVKNVRGHGEIPDLSFAMSVDADFEGFVVQVLGQKDLTLLLRQFDSFLTSWAGVKSISQTELNSREERTLVKNVNEIYYNQSKVTLTLQQLAVIKKYNALRQIELIDKKVLVRGKEVFVGDFYKQKYKEITRELLVKLLIANGYFDSQLEAANYDYKTDDWTLGIGSEQYNWNSFYFEMLRSSVKIINEPEELNYFWMILAGLTDEYSTSNPDLVEGIGQLISYYKNAKPLSPIFNSESFKLVDAEVHVGGNAADKIIGSHIDDAIHGKDGDDEIKGFYGHDTIFGGKGDDRLFGQWGSDRLSGGWGDDYIDGGKGKDFYQWKIGDGNDVFIPEVKKQDKDVLFLGKKVSRKKLKISKSQDDLHIIVLDSNERLTVKGWFLSEEHQSIEIRLQSDKGKLDILEAISTE